VNYSRLIIKIDKQERTIDSLEKEIRELNKNYGNATLKLYSIMQNTNQISISTYTALAIAIISIILTTVNTRRTLYRLKRIEEYIKNIVEDTEIE
jgi:ABC-type spermidine/putrescine transport system permease subunit II